MTKYFLIKKNSFYHTLELLHLNNINYLGMKDVFDTYDTKNQGFIKTSLLGNILRTIGFNPIESDIQRATQEVDPLSKKEKQIFI